MRKERRKKGKEEEGKRATKRKNKIDLQPFASIISIISQTRLNAVAVCHVHQDILDAIDIAALVKLFVSRNDTRLYMFRD